MNRTFWAATLLAPSALALASCNYGYSGDRTSGGNTAPESEASSGPFEVSQMGAFDEPWALAFQPGTGNLFVTEKRGAIKFLRPTGEIGEVSGVPAVAYGGQGGLGDLVFAPDYTTSRTIYLSWAEGAGAQDTDSGAGERRAVVGRGKLSCPTNTRCAIENLDVIWRQEPALVSPGHFSHRIAFSRDGSHLFIASGERMKGEPAQDMTNNLGKIVRLTPDGEPAPGNPFANRGGVAAQIWSLGHRNILGLAFDLQGNLWDLEHGPAGGDELNLVESGSNYGWPLVSGGDHYNGTPIPGHSTRPEFAAPAIEWTPVIAPGDFIFYSGGLFPRWRGDALIAGLKTEALIRVTFDGGQAHEAERFDFGMRLRDIAQGPDGAIWLVGDGSGGKLLKLTPKS